MRVLEEVFKIEFRTTFWVQKLTVTMRNNLVKSNIKIIAHDTKELLNYLVTINIQIDGIILDRMHTRIM